MIGFQDMSVDLWGLIESVRLGKKAQQGGGLRLMGIELANDSVSFLWRNGETCRTQVLIEIMLCIRLDII